MNGISLYFFKLNIKSIYADIFVIKRKMCNHRTVSLWEPTKLQYLLQYKIV